MKNENSIISFQKIGRRTKLFINLNDKVTMIGAYNKISKYDRFDFDFDGKSYQKYVVEISATKQDNKGRQVREIELEKGLHNEIGEFIKVNGRLPSFSPEILDEAYYQFEDYIIDGIKGEKKFIVPAYGYFSPYVLFTPDKYSIENIDLESNQELKSFVQIFEKPKVKVEDIKKEVEMLYKYVKNDQVNLLVMSFGFASLFRYYMFSLGLEDFPFLALISNVTQKGKSARGRVLINGLFLNWPTKSFHTASILNGSDERFHELNKIMAPIVFEEIQSLGNEKTSFLKQLATSNRVQSRISLQGGIGTYSRNFIRGGIMVTANELKEIDSTLKDRFIVIDLSEYEEYKNAQKHYDFLKDNINKVSYYIWQNINLFGNCIKLENKSRKSSYKNVLMNGMRCCNLLFNHFGFEPLLLDIDSFLVNKEEVIKTDKTRKRRKIIEFIKKFTTYVSKDGYIKKNIFDIQSLQFDFEKNKQIINTILHEAYYNGIVAGEEGILIGKTFLEKMKEEDDTFFNLKNIHNLKQFFPENSVMSYRSGDNDDPNCYLDYYAYSIPPRKQKTGIMLTNIWKEEDSIDDLNGFL